MGVSLNPLLSRTAPPRRHPSSVLPPRAAHFPAETRSTERPATGHPVFAESCPLLVPKGVVEGGRGPTRMGAPPRTAAGLGCRARLQVASPTRHSLGANFSLCHYFGPQCLTAGGAGWAQHPQHHPHAAPGPSSPPSPIPCPDPYIAKARGEERSCPFWAGRRLASGKDAPGVTRT